MQISGFRKSSARRRGEQKPHGAVGGALSRRTALAVFSQLPGGSCWLQLAAAEGEINQRCQIAARIVRPGARRHEPARVGLKEAQMTSGWVLERGTIRLHLHKGAWWAWSKTLFYLLNSLFIQLKWSFELLQKTRHKKKKRSYAWTCHTRHVDGSKIILIMLIYTCLSLFFNQLACR